MISSGIFGVLRGTVKIRVEGFFTERFINICISENILLWNLKKEGEETLLASISSKDFKRIKSAARKTKSSVRIVKKSGAPFVARRYRKRKYALLGAFAAVFCFWFYSFHIMGIDISGYERLKKEDIRSALREFGVYEWARKDKIDRKFVQNSMMTKMGDISWIGINIKGSRVYVEVRERVKTEEKIPLNVPCDLVASESGIIKELDIRGGQSLVKKNEFVEKGDLLVSGAMDSEALGIRYVHSYGEVYALTQKSFEKEYKKEIVEKVLTGRQKKQRALCISSREIRLYLKKDGGYRYYEKKTEEKEVPFLKIFRLKTEILSEQKEQRVKRGEAEIIAVAKEEFEKKVKSDLKSGEEIKKIFAEYREKDPETLVVTVNFEIIENIAKERTIDKIENLNYDIGEGEKSPR